MLRKPDSIPASDTVISDPALEPFFITRSQTGGFTLYERVIKGENNTKYIKTICYPANFSYALKKAAEELLNMKKEFTTISSYIKDYKNIEEKITNVIL
tara:strand:+ start:1044 stop:1340 length:297 start_codon:yes stop_codon:yes gene_type:complete